MSTWLSQILFASAALASSGLAGEPEVHWRGKVYSPATLPSTLDAGSREAVKRWQALAKELELRIDVDDRGRVVVLSPLASNYIEQAGPLVQKTFDLFERALPTTEKRPTPSATAPVSPPKADVPEPLPEDPEEPPAGAPPKSAPTQRTDAPTTTAAEAAPSAAVMVFLQDAKDYARSLETLARGEPYLRSWVPEATGESGYVLERPLCGAMVINQPDQEEWNPYNEIVNRCMQLAVLQRFGRQPNWAMQGLGWYAEFQVLGSVYCFPYRDEFVSVAEHTDWDRTLQARYGGEDAPELRVADFADWKRGTWKTSAAHAAWGAIDYLARRNGRELASLFDDLRAATDVASRRVHADGTWDTRRDFELPLAEQERLLVQHFGAKCLVEMRADWARGGGKR